MTLTVQDDSGSMAFYPDRIDDLKVILTRVVSAATLFDDDGISVRFINWQPPENPRPEDNTMPLSSLNNIRDEAYVERLVSMTPFKGLTAVGSKMKQHILYGPLLNVMTHVKDRTLAKPVLILTVTDGQPAGETIGPNDTALRDVIRDTSTELSKYPMYGSGAISFQFAQVGNDEEAKRFLARLDNDPVVGSLVDCTSSMPNSSITM